MFGTHVTGIELGPNYCVLVRAGRRGAKTTVAAAHAITPSDWPVSHEGLAELLRLERRTNRFPHKARVVLWGGQEKAEARALATAALTSAGFEIENAISPADALADLVARRQGTADRGPVAALSLNAHGAVIAVVSNGQVLTSRAFDWPLGEPFSGNRPELLERYLVISQLAPQLQHIIDLARPVYGAHVTSAIACGNLPNLRSLMMLLIEEMDIEVETLDAADLLEPQVAAGIAVESVPALQLACAAAVGSAARRVHVVDTRRTPGSPPPPQIEPRPQAPATARSTMSPIRQMVAVGALILCAAWSVSQASGWTPVVPAVVGGGLEMASATPAVPELRPEATMGRIDPIGAAPEAPPPAATRPPVRRSRPAASTAGSSIPEPAHLEIASQEIAPPKVDGIMISGDRRLAIVGGEIVAPGDRVGGLTVIRIERDGVQLRDSSGRETYVAIRMRKPEPGG